MSINHSYLYHEVDGLMHSDQSAVEQRTHGWPLESKGIPLYEIYRHASVQKYRPLRCHHPHLRSSALSDLG